MLINPPKVLATVCARGGSKGVPMKNIRMLHGKPLIQYTLECIEKSKYINEFVISSDSDEILEVAAKLGYATEYKRPSEFATDKSAKIDAIRHATEYVEQTRGFFPELRTPADVDACIEAFANDASMETMVTVYPAERSPYFNMVEKKQTGYYNLVNIPNPPVVRRQDAPTVYSITPAIFAWRRNTMHITHLYEGNWGIYEMPIERAIDIDTEFEFKLVDFLMGQP
jgi:CMP-N,N'-diacetyllegionaminic acid synthase